MALSFSGLSRSWKGAFAGAMTLAAAVGLARPAHAQGHTFHLDRLEMPGAPDDGLVLFRPVTQPNSIVYAQIGFGYSLNPLRMSDLLTGPQDQGALRQSPSNAITNQFSNYFSGGIELFDRLTLGLTFPVTWWQTGNQPSGTTSPFGVGSAGNTYTVDGPAAGDLRIDARYVAWRKDDRSMALGLQLSLFAPTGSGSASNFGGDGSTGVMPMVTWEWTPMQKFPIAFVVNTGVVFRPENSIGDPAGNHGSPDGLGVGNEWRWGVGAFLPIKDGKYRVGVDVFGQTGITGSGDQTTGNTFFTRQNTPLEWDIEGRMKLPRMLDNDQFYVGAGAGSLFTPGYGAPDLRVLAVIGTYWSIEDTSANSPAARAKVRESIRESLKDTDGDGIPDDIDACPEVPEDHKDPDPMDGCPAPADRDGDGIPDQYDKCPDQPEDKDGVDDQDGCPEDDADQDGIPDAKDACPKEPGQPDPDPKKNGCPKFIKLEGSTVRVLQQVHFATGSATILPDSFPMLQEIVALLKATPGIKKMRIEGHTDNRGAADMNLDLSKRRAASVKSWLVLHGIEEMRLESEGYGLTKPIQTNDTDAGRQANRRVEFHITEEDTGGGPPPKR
jgi:outer membrane protein OmpA-like peptidoglycan-associated protein